MTNTEIIAILQTKYPKFTKSTLSMVHHPEKYGIRLTKEAETMLKGEKKPAARKRTRPNRLTVYVDDDELAAVRTAAEEAGYKTMQNYLSSLIRSKL